MGCSRCSFPRFVIFFDDRFSQLHSVVLGESEFSRPRAESVKDNPIHRKIEDQRVEAAALRPIVVDRAPAIDEKNAMAIHVDELQVVIVVDEIEVPSPRCLEPLGIGLGQGHAGLEATAVAIVIKTGISAPSHSVLSISSHWIPLISN